MKVHHRPYSFEDGPVVYPANAFASRLRGDKLRLGSGPTKSQKKTFRVEEREKERGRGSNLRRQRLARSTAQVLVAQTTQPVQKNQVRDEL